MYFAASLFDKFSSFLCYTLNLEILIVPSRNAFCIKDAWQMFKEIILKKKKCSKKYTKSYQKYTFK